MAGNSTASIFAEQWRNPSGFLSLLMILGGPVIQTALAQLTGPAFVPICFSFGWVSYAFSTISALVGDGRLMPPPDNACKVINLKNGYARTNRSWVVGRLLRDLEEPLSSESLLVSVYGAKAPPDKSVAGAKSGLFGSAAIIIQLIISIIPWIRHHDWGIFMITAAGTCIALSTAALPQWRVEKFACRAKTSKDIAITAGNGSRHVVVILGNGHGLDVEDLAAGEGPRQQRPWKKVGWFIDKKTGEAKLFRGLPQAFCMTRLTCAIFILLWAGVLVSVIPLTENAWYLVGVGTIGMIQNAIIAAASRTPESRGFHLERPFKFNRGKVMDVLKELETWRAGCGRALLKEFFPAGLDPDRKENEWWDEKERKDRGERATSDGESQEERAQPKSLPAGVETTTTTDTKQIVPDTTNAR